MRRASAQSVVAVALASVILVGVGAACNGGSTSAPGSAASPKSVAVAGCPTTLVHYTPRPGAEASLRILPWIAAAPSSSQIIGYLFYYGVPGVAWREHHAKGLRIYSGGIVPAGGGADTKILWIDYSQRSRGAMIAHGQRLDAPGEFHQAFGMLGASVIDVPSRRMLASHTPHPNDYRRGHHVRHRTLTLQRQAPRLIPVPGGYGP